MDFVAPLVFTRFDEYMDLMEEEKPSETDRNPDAVDFEDVVHEREANGNGEPTFPGFRGLESIAARLFPLMPTPSSPQRVDEAALVDKLVDAGIAKPMAEIVAQLRVNDSIVKDAKIGGMEEIKDLLQRTVLNPMSRPDLHTGILSMPRGILMYGPPGTGKTMMAKWLAAQSGGTFFNITAGDCQGKFVGETPKIIKAIFTAAEICAPSVVFFDELDSLFGARGSGGMAGNYEIEMKNALLSGVDGLTNDLTKQVVIVGATNRPEEIDTAALRRFSKRLLLALPDEKTRDAQLRMNFSGVSNSLTEEDFKWMAETTDNWNGSDLHSLAKRSAEVPYREYLDNLGDKGLGDHLEKLELRLLRRSDVDEAFEAVKPSGTKTSRKMLRFHDKYGSN